MQADSMCPLTNIQRLKPKVSFTLIELLIVVAIMAVLMSLLLPVLGRARETARRASCLSNMHQMCLAIQSYVGNYNGFFPPAALDTFGIMSDTQYAWDFIRSWNYTTNDWDYKPGLIWDAWGTTKIQQCPAFTGPAMWNGDKYTGYNYNTSYIGWAEPVGGWSAEEYIPTARITEIQRPEQCAIFGDGQYGNNQANKFMRAPIENEREKDISNATRHAGTQGFRHLKTTNVAFADGHAESRRDRHTKTYSSIQKYIGIDCGFLSDDNSLYDLE
jgi:prepilin-type processing-associated H-X9-DG protein/prepilin-type N-terminal cleavage/methylation domain-containing protein